MLEEHRKPKQKLRDLGIYSPISLLAIIGIIVGASNSAEPFSGELFLGSLIILGVVVSCYCLGLHVSDSKTSSTSGDSAKLEAILEAMQMSENAKRILFRDRELDLIRNTIQADIESEDFHAALVLCDQMANVFGAVEEAEEMRTNVQEIIHQHHEERIHEELNQLNELISNRQWVESYQFAARLRRLYPESPLLHELEQNIADMRTEYGHALEDRFLSAAKNDNVEDAMILLRELDKYLTPEDARRFRDTANSVIKTYRESLGAKFKMAVNDHRWQQAIEFGGELVAQFPNTKMAEEIKDILNTIQVRAVEDETES
jgi:hypothetical protein